MPVTLSPPRRTKGLRLVWGEMRTADSSLRSERHAFPRTAAISQHHVGTVPPLLNRRGEGRNERVGAARQVFAYVLLILRRIRRPLRGLPDNKVPPGPYYGLPVVCRARAPHITFHLLPAAFTFFLPVARIILTPIDIPGRVELV
jgi:hypothetical protein